MGGRLSPYQELQTFSFKNQPLTVNGVWDGWERGTQPERVGSMGLGRETGRRVLINSLESLEQALPETDPISVAKDICTVCPSPQMVRSRRSETLPSPICTPGLCMNINTDHEDDSGICALTTLCTCTRSVFPPHPGTSGPWTAPTLEED